MEWKCIDFAEPVDDNTWYARPFNTCGILSVNDVARDPSHGILCNCDHPGSRKLDIGSVN